MVVIGGGLTAIDTATESLAYYPVQVEKFLARYETSGRRESAKRRCAPTGTTEEARNRRRIPRACARHPRRARRRGSATARRRDSIDAAAALGRRHHRLSQAPDRQPRATPNHEEVEKALEEGIRFAECLSPMAVRRRRATARPPAALHAQVRGEDGSWSAGEFVTCRRAPCWSPPARSPTRCWRARTPRMFQLDGKYFRRCDEAGRNRVSRNGQSSKPATSDVLLLRLDDGRFISFFGDLHPSYCRQRGQGDGVAPSRAIPMVSRVLAPAAAAAVGTDAAFFAARSTTSCAPRVHAVIAPDARPSSRWWCSAVRGRAQFQSGPVLSVAELRDAGAE